LPSLFNNFHCETQSHAKRDLPTERPFQYTLQFCVPVKMGHVGTRHGDEGCFVPPSPTSKRWVHAKYRLLSSDFCTSGSPFDFFSYLFFPPLFFFVELAFKKPLTKAPVEKADPFPLFCFFHETRRVSVDVQFAISRLPKYSGVQTSFPLVFDSKL